VTIEELERGMKILWDGHVHSAERLDRIEAIQENAELEMAELRASLVDLQASESTMLDGLERPAQLVTNIGEAQATLIHARARTDESMAALSEDLQRLAKRMDTFIATLHNGRQTEQ